MSFHYDAFLAALHASLAASSLPQLKDKTEKLRSVPGIGDTTAAMGTQNSIKIVDSQDSRYKTKNKKISNILFGFSNTFISKLNDSSSNTNGSIVVLLDIFLLKN